jgi:hypothetical protein
MQQVALHARKAEEIELFCMLSPTSRVVHLVAGAGHACDEVFGSVPLQGIIGTAISLWADEAGCMHIYLCWALAPARECVLIVCLELLQHVGAIARVEVRCEPCDAAVQLLVGT